VRALIEVLWAELRSWRALWKKRRACHGSRWCCQYVDGSQCNSAHDPHRVARWRLRVQWWREVRREAREAA
jgi:hypothetical protein